MRTETTLTDRISDAGFRALMAMARALPYPRRVAFMGSVMRTVIGPVAGFPRRIRKNLASTCPDLGPKEVERIVQGSIDNMGRTIVEIYSGNEFAERCAAMEVRGPGLAILEDAHSRRQPVVLITGHFGNYDAPRAALIARGFDIAGLYRPMNNALFNRHYVDAMTAIGPAFPRDTRGTTGLVRHLRKGGMAEFLIDQHYSRGTELTFFGRPAMTSVVPAELSLRYKAPLVPMYGIRQPDGLSFDLIVEAPIPPSDAVTMTQALNDSLEALTRSHMEQWMWVHRRWKVPAG